MSLQGQCIYANNWIRRMYQYLLCIALSAQCNYANDFTYPELRMFLKNSEKTSTDNIFPFLFSLCNQSVYLTH